VRLDERAEPEDEHDGGRSGEGRGDAKHRPAATRNDDRTLEQLHRRYAQRHGRSSEVAVEPCAAGTGRKVLAQHRALKLGQLPVESQRAPLARTLAIRCKFTETGHLFPLTGLRFNS
jgi:hypothetical protein